MSNGGLNEFSEFLTKRGKNGTGRDYERKGSLIPESLSLSVEFTD